MALSQKKLQQKRENKNKKRTTSKTNKIKPATSSSNYIKYSSPEEQDKRIIEIFSEKNVTHVPVVDDDSLAIYSTYLEKKIPSKTKLTGMEDVGYFGWEEGYFFGAMDEEDYLEMKAERGSYQDIYLFLEIDYIDEENGIIAKVERIEDKKIFHIPLEDLEGCDNNKEVNDIINDYSYWKVNY